MSDQENPEKTKEKDYRDFQVRTLRERNDTLALFDFLKSIFGFLGMNGKNDAALALMDDVTEEDIISSPVYQSELKSKGIDFQTVYIPRPEDGVGSSSNPSVGYGAAYGVFASDDTADAALRAAVSIGIERYTKQSIENGVTYKMGAKGEKNQIDCSGFLDKTTKNAMSFALPEGGKNLTGIFCTHSDGQLSALSRQTGFLLEGTNVNMSTLKAGMIIGIDSGDKGWDQGRENGIDHIGVVYADSKTGQLMFAESRGGKGVMATPLDEWLKMADKENYKLFASDLVQLASEDYKKQVAQKIEQNSELAAAAPEKAATDKVTEQIPASVVQASAAQTTSSLLGKPA